MCTFCVGILCLGAFAFCYRFRNDIRVVAEANAGTHASIALSSWPTVIVQGGAWRATHRRKGALKGGSSGKSTFE